VASLTEDKIVNLSVRELALRLVEGMDPQRSIDIGNYIGPSSPSSRRSRVWRNQCIGARGCPSPS
jgi:hypothetical protein